MFCCLHGQWILFVTLHSLSWYLTGFSMWKDWTVSDAMWYRFLLKLPVLGDLHFVILNFLNFHKSSHIVKIRNILWETSKCGCASNVNVNDDDVTGDRGKISSFLVTWGHIRPLRCYAAAMTTNFECWMNGFPEKQTFLFSRTSEISKMYRILGHSHCKYVENAVRKIWKYCSIVYAR